MNTQERLLAEQKSAPLIANLPSNIKTILMCLPATPRWTLAATVNELRTKGNSNVYLRGIAIGQATASFDRAEITKPQLDALALYIGNLPD